MSRRKSTINYDFDKQSTPSWFRRNWWRLLFVSILIVLAIGTASALIIVLITDAAKEQALKQKKTGWARRWQTIEPFVKKFPLGLALGFVRNLIVLAIEREPDLQ